jgi:hypothetical protein
LLDHEAKSVQRTRLLNVTLGERLRARPCATSVSALSDDTQADPAPLSALRPVGCCDIVRRESRTHDWLRGVDQLNLIALDADIIKGRSAVVGFLESCGYGLTEYTDRQLQISGVRAL